MRKRLECEVCDKTFRNRRALAGHMRLAHNVLMGEKQEIKDHLKQDGERLDKLTEIVEGLVDDVEDIKAMIKGLEKDLIEGEEETEELVASNPLDVEKLKQDLKAEIKKELEEENIKGEEERLKSEEEKRREEEQKEKEKKEKEDKSWFM